MRCALLAFALFLALGSAGGCAVPSTVTECAKVLCEAGDYCLSVEADAADEGDTAALPECAAPPAACGDRAACDCLTDCLSCTESAQGVYCTVAAE